MLHPLLNLIFQKERIAGINAHGMQLAALGQIIDVLTGTSQHFCGLCGINHPVGDEAAKIVQRKRNLHACTIEGSVVNHRLIAPSNAIAICLHCDTAEDVVASQYRNKCRIAFGKWHDAALSNHAIPKENQ